MSDEILITRHAAERYIERVRPGIDVAQATRELRALMRMDSFRPESPDWQTGESPGQDQRLYMEPCDGVALAVVGRTLKTVLTRAGTSPERMSQRRARKARKRASRKARRWKNTDKHGLPRGRTDEWRQDG